LVWSCIDAYTFVNAAATVWMAAPGMICFLQTSVRRVQLPCKKTYGDLGTHLLTLGYREVWRDGIADEVNQHWSRSELSDNLLKIRTTGYTLNEGNVGTGSNCHLQSGDSFIDPESETAFRVRSIPQPKR
jgi:hypothetical protein